MFCKHSGYTDASRIANGLRRLLSHSHGIRLDFLQWWRQTILYFNAFFLVQGQGVCNISNCFMDPLIKSFPRGESSSFLLFCPTFIFTYSEGKRAPNLQRLSYIPYCQSLFFFFYASNMCLKTYLHLTLLQQGRYWHQLTVCSCCCWSWNVSWAIVLSRVLSSALSSCTSLISSSNWKNTKMHKHRVNNMMGQRGKQHFVQVQNLWMAVEDAALCWKSKPSRKRRKHFLV